MNSPCISECHIHLCGICEGCGRTLLEIEHWSSMTDPQKRLVMSLVLARANRFGVVLPGRGQI